MSDLFDAIKANSDLDSDDWQPIDYKMGKCSLEDIGRPKPQISGGRATRLARRYTTTVVQSLADIVADPKQAASDRIKAGIVLLDRGWGKPTETIKADVDSTIRIELKYSNPNFNMQPPTPTEHVVDVTPKAIESTPANSAPDIASAYQSHLDANKAAREYDNAHPKPWLDKPLSPPPAAPGAVFRPPPPAPGTAAAVEASLRAKGELPPVQPREGV